MRAKKINEIQNFKRGENPYNKLDLGDLNKKPIGDDISSQDKSKTYSKYLDEQMMQVDDFIYGLHMDILNNTTGLDYETEAAIPEWLKNIDNYAETIQSKWEDIKGILEIYTYTGKRLND